MLVRGRWVVFSLGQTSPVGNADWEFVCTLLVFAFVFGLQAKFVPSVPLLFAIPLAILEASDLVFRLVFR